MCAFGERVYSMTLTWVEKALASEMGAAAEAFFRRVYELPCVDAKRLREDERTFAYRQRQLNLDLHQAEFDPAPTYALLLTLGQRLPAQVSSTIVRFLQ